ncbi:MAG: hypothetical protein NTV86_12910 [Planctomycetota bacterium]|nr:hypothetical protein [Planctomycetota bacterium]
MTLTDEQFEDILAGGPCPEGLPHADLARLAQARALRLRLRGAFDGVRAEASLSARVQTALRGRTRGERTSPWRRVAWRWIPAAVAAAALIVLVPAVLRVAAPTPAAAASAQDLVRIHENNLAAAGGFFPADDRERLLATLRDKLQFDPVALPTGPDVKLQGGCLVRLANRQAGGYLLAVGDNRVTVIVSRDWPDDLGLSCSCGQAHCTCYHKGRCSGCNLVSKRIGEYAYTVVGDAPPAQLQAILARIPA